MLHVTEDTPPDMLAGAMDLAVHLPTGRTVKMSVERSTPMMDLLVQITTNHQLQLSNYTLQALGMAPSAERGDKPLPYKPNTPIGTLDTQHVKVIPKSRSLPVTKAAAPGHQPFESTFRLKVHLPRNQLYVTRVSRNVLLEDIMKKVCEEKNLDPVKYEFKHPANLDEILDPKLTLSDYQITEIYVVSKGTVSLSQAFSTSDIMALRKEEERKQMHNKTGGGVFNLIFRRGKSSMGSGSISSDTRSISPTHSDDSRSVTPPNVQQPILAPPKKDPPPDRPKPPQRKRRPAPKPPQAAEEARRSSGDSRTATEDSRRGSEVSRTATEVSRTPTEDSRTTADDSRTAAEDSRRSSDGKTSQVSEVSELRRIDNGLVISHSRNSSDSSGYHEASVLSENCNASLPRRPKSAFVGAGEVEKISKMHSQSTTNLSKMASHSKSTTSLGMTGRKKKAAPPPPPAIRASNPSINLAAPSPVVASQPSLPIQAAPCTSQDLSLARSSNPVPLPRGKTRAPPVPVPRNINAVDIKPTTSDISRIVEKVDETDVEELVEELHDAAKGSKERFDTPLTHLRKEISAREEEEIVVKGEDSVASLNGENTLKEPTSPVKQLENLQSQLQHNLFSSTIFKNNQKKVFEAENASKSCKSTKGSEAVLLNAPSVSNNPQSEAVSEHEKSSKSVGSPGGLGEVSINAPSVSNNPQPVESGAVSPNASNISPEKKLPEVVGVIPKTPEKKVSQSKFDTFGKRRLQVLASLTTSFDEDSRSEENKSSTLSSCTSLTSTLGSLNCVDDFSDLDENVFSKSKTKKSSDQNVFNQLYGIHGLEDVNLEEVKLGKNQSVSSLTSLRSLPGFMSGGLKKWNNMEYLDSESMHSLGPSSNGGWVVGDSEPASLTSQQALDSLPSITSNDILPNSESKPFGSTDSGIAPEIQEKNEEEEAFVTSTPPPPILDEDIAPPTEEKTVGKSLTEDLLIPPPIKLVVEVARENILEHNAIETGAQEAKVAPAATELREATVASAAKDSGESTTEDLVIPPPIELVIEVTKEDILEDKASGASKATVAAAATEVPEATAAVERANEAADELDWQYQLPSPPKAFRDCSPAEVVEADFKDSVVTSPELFEKLKTLEDVQSEGGTLTSDLTSVVSEEEVPLLNTLTLENLEKRRSLVYNRELTSLKMEDDARLDTFSGSLTKFEATFSELQQQQKFVQKPTSGSNHALPNFKISTYDKPKQRIKVFEDDTIRSSTDKPSGPRGTLQRTYMGRSMESISMRKNSAGEEYDFARPVAKRFEHSASVFRSESFSKEYSPAKPVLRSKSHVTLDGARYRVDGKGENKEDGVSRSNSFYDVSGLQSLGVMRLIQNKLNTPTSSMENLAPPEKPQKPLLKPEPPKEPPQKQSPLPEAIPPEKKPAAPEKIYKYSGPPAINMSTWSERPKVPVSVAEDKDYTSGNNNNITSKLIVSTTNNNITSNNSIEIRDKQQGVSVKVNGTTEPTAPGNVVIKIGAFNPQPPKTIDNQRFINHTTAAGYRKPFNSISNQRPHSIAFDSDFDISRVPVVRSVELKKPLKSTSVTQIHKEEPPKASSKWQAPVVRGFSTNNTWNHRWSSYGTLPEQAKEKDSFTTNSQVPFGQATLRRTDSNKFLDRTNEEVQPPSRPDLVLGSKSEVVRPPPPPTMPKVVLKKPVVRPVEPVLDQRDQLLSAIRNFGGKKGLRGVKA